MKRRVGLAIAVCIYAAVLPALAEKHPLSAQEYRSRILSQRWGVTLGGYAADFRTDAQIGFGTLLGSLIRLESDLEMEPRKESFRVDGFYRFGQRQSLDFGVYRFRRDGGTKLDEPVDFLGLRFEGTTSSAFDMDSYRLFWRYAFVNDGRTHAGLAAGLSTFDFGVAIEGLARVIDEMTGEPVGSATLEQAEASFLAPVPAVGMFVERAFHHRWILRARADFFDLSLNDFEGRLIETRFTMDWFFSKNVGLGVGVGTTDITYRDLDSKKPIRVDYRYTGLLFYLSMAFGGG